MSLQRTFNVPNSQFCESTPMLRSKSGVTGPIRYSLSGAVGMRWRTGRVRLPKCNASIPFVGRARPFSASHAAFPSFASFQAAPSKTAASLPIHCSAPTLRAIKNRFESDSDDAHSDRFWAKALRQHAPSRKAKMGAVAG